MLNNMGISIILCMLLCIFGHVSTDEGENTYQQARQSLNRLHHAKSKYLRTNNVPSLDVDTALKLSKLLNMENILRNIDEYDLSDDSFDVPVINSTAGPSTPGGGTQDGMSSDAATTDGRMTSSNVQVTSTTAQTSSMKPRKSTAKMGITTVDMESTTVHFDGTTNGMPKTTESKGDATTNMKSKGTTDHIAMTTMNEGDTTVNTDKTKAQTTRPTSKPRPSYDVSPLCFNHTTDIIAGLFARKSWAVNMLDATGKPGPGLKNGNILWQGDYEECMGVKVVNKFHGKMCLATITVGATTQINPLTGQPAGIYVALCLPNSCSTTDIKNLLNSVLTRMSNNTVHVVSVTCSETLQSYDTRAIIVLAVIGLFIALLVLGTAYDVITRQMSKSKARNKADIHQNGGTQWKTIMGKPNEGYEADDTVKENGSVDYKYRVSGETELPSFEEAVEHTESYKPGILGQLLLSFSVYTNGAKILSTNQGAGTLTAVNGIRFISMTWVILGHTYAFGLRAVGNVMSEFPKLVSRRSFMAIINAEVSVDTFFALSGCLLTYLVLRQMKKEKGKINWFMFYFHRFWRLTPPYMLVMMVYLALFPYLGSGPLWPKNGTEKNYCKNTWWYNILYINNLIKVGDQCFAWAWYLANDMQFYVISPIIIVSLYFSKIAGTVITAVFLVGTTIATGIISQHNELGISTFGENALEYFEQYYEKPYCRMGPYLVGMYTGFILYKTNCKCNIDKYLNLILWGVFAAAACAVLYGVYDDFNGHHVSVEVAALYNAVHKTVWGAAICWVIFACATGNGGFVNTILSWKGLIPLSRLTYCAYLVHPPVMYYFYYSKKRLIYWDDHEVIYEFLGHVGLSYAVAFVASLAFESPMMGLEKVIFKRGQKK